MEIYEPAEDSELIKKHISALATGTVLDMGTGTGVLALEAAQHAEKVVALDINPTAIHYCNTYANHPKVKYHQSDLFTAFSQNAKNTISPSRFDLIIFNPPYLPADAKYPDIALDGGKKGHEIIEKFLKQARKHLKKNGTILLLFSSLTNQNKIHQILAQQQYKFTEMDRQKLDFETLYVYRVTA
jgi:release factor glutamine methyltransferase